MGTVLSKDGTTIAFDRVGQGPVVILVSGALGVRSHPIMADLAAHLAPHVTVINYDRRGRGESGDTPPYAVEREVDDIDALIDGAGGSAFLYGLSSGAVLALEAASRLSSKVTKLALSSSPADSARPQNTAVIAYHPEEVTGDRTMTEQTTTHAPYRAAEPHPDLRSLEPLVGTWTLSGDTQGAVTYEWMDGGFFLVQHIDMEHDGHRIKGLEIIGHLRPFGEEPSEDITSRFYDTLGNTLDYVYELAGTTFMIWGGEKGSPAYFTGTFSADGNTCTGQWVYPGGGGYESTMTRVTHA